MITTTTTTMMAHPPPESPSSTSTPSTGPRARTATRARGSPAGTRHDRKLAFHTELAREARRLETGTGTGTAAVVVIAGDLNVAPGPLDGFPRLRVWPRQHVVNRADFQGKFFASRGVGDDGGGGGGGGGSGIDWESGKGALYGWEARGEEDERGGGGGGGKREKEKEKNEKGFDGVDTFRHIHGDQRRYTYYPRGVEWGSSCDRVDLVIVSRSLVEEEEEEEEEEAEPRRRWQRLVVVDAGIGDYSRDRGPSDHRPVWVEIGWEGEGGQ
ncbi:hypothetical protein F4778DRAFT_635163 [Xylariomycetidae sp. FL2044]|nr:hypothetical protein F4778DRAFT_635163 [Xylariomycetidae sp. FL2044]